MTIFTPLRRLAEHAYSWRPEAPFTLASGERSPHYVDCRAALSRPHVLKEVGDLFWGRIHQGVDAVGGLTLGADPIAMAPSLASFVWPSRGCVRWFSVRKEPKPHGAGGRIVGALEPGQQVAIVDDVATTGGSTIQAIRACRDFGCYVKQAIVLVDRQSGGLEAIQKELDAVPHAGGRADATAVCTLDQVIAEWQALT